MNVAGGLVSATSRHMTSRNVAWIGGILIAVIVAMAAFDIVRSYRIAVEEAGRELETQARIIAEQTARSVQAVDIVLRHVAAEFLRGRLSTLAPAELHAYLNEQAVGLAQIDGIAMHDAAGNALAISWLPVGSNANVAHFEAFAAVREAQQSELFVSSATRSPSDHQWMIPLVRRLETPTGQFAGVIAARGRIDYFQEFYRDFRLEPGTKVTLMHRNATLVARYPAVDEVLGQHFPQFESLLAMRAQRRPAPLRTVSPVDGIERFSAVESVPGLPLEVLVTRDTDVALASWRQTAWGTAARTLALAALAVGLIALLTREFARVSAVRDSLNASHERFALAVAGSNDGIWDWDQRTNKVFASARARELLGLPSGPEKVPSHEWFAALHFHPQDEPRRLAAMKAHLAGKTQLYEGEYRVRHLDGSYSWVRIRGMGIRDAGGKVLRMAGSISDIDAQKRAEEALRVSEERYAIAMTGSNEGHWVWDITTDELYASPIVKAVFGLDADEPITTRTLFLERVRIHPADIEMLQRNIANHLEGRTQRLEHEFRVLLPDDSVRWIQTRGQCFRDSEGRPLRMAGASIVITERKRAEQALRQSEQRYQLAIAGVNQGVWDWDLETDMVFMSDRAQELLGQQPGARLRHRRQWIALWDYDPEDVVHVRRALADYLHGATPTFEVEYRMRDPSGAFRWYHDRGVALRDERGRPYRMAGSIEDVTDRKEAEAQRDRLEGQLRQAQKLEAMGTLAGGVAHDFNNILSAILGYGDLAQKAAAEGTSLRRYIDAAMSAGMRAKSLVERILAFSRSGMGERVQVHVQSVVAEVLDIVEGALPAGVALERTLAAGDAAVLSDPTQLHQVVMNLCSNAVQAIEGAGRVSVSTETVALKEPWFVTTCSLPPGDYVRLRVADTGTGIDPKIIDRIFDPFFTTKDVGVGTGLGLSLVHGIVTDLGGGIDVQNRPGGGAAFSVYVPWQGNIAPPAKIEEPVRRGCGETIMLVDDETALVHLGEEMMAELGYEPVGFSSSAKALEAFSRAPERFDAVLSDEAMPGLTGCELAERIHCIRPDVPIVLVSGFASAALAARARDAGVVEVLAKPLVARDIARCLANALHGETQRRRRAVAIETGHALP
jgi:PAS domain S-box-containing protein